MIDKWNEESLKNKILFLFFPPYVLRYAINWFLVVGIYLGIYYHTFSAIKDELVPIKGTITGAFVNGFGGNSITGGGYSTYYFKLDTYPAVFTIDNIGLLKKYNISGELFVEGTVIESNVSESHRLYNYVDFDSSFMRKDCIQIYGIRANGEQELSVFGCLTDKAYRSNMLVLVPLFIYWLILTILGVLVWRDFIDDVKYKWLKMKR